MSFSRAKRKHAELGNPRSQITTEDDDHGEPSNDEEPVEKRDRPVKKAKRSHPRGLEQNLLMGGSYAGGTYKSNMFKLQADQLLGQVKRDRSAVDSPVKTALSDLKTLIDSMVAKEPLSVWIYIYFMSFKS